MNGGTNAQTRVSMPEAQRVNVPEPIQQPVN
jgi:hypothetical protein